MKRLFTIIVMSLFAAGALVALRVSEKELKKGKRVPFLKYQGRYNRIMSREELRGIGARLARMAAQPNRYYAIGQRYAIIRAVDPRVKDKFDSDIFSLGPRSDIVDINAVRIIIGAYLENRYKYSQSDGVLLATFITYYNATYRGNTAYLGGRYKPVVMRYLTRFNAGISRRYYEWPGRTRILIPLATGVDSSEITRRRVVEDLRKQPDRGIPERKKMLNFKERELDRARKDLERRKRDLEKDRGDITKRKDETRKREDTITKKKEDLKKETDPEKREALKKDIKKDEEKLKKDEEKIRKDEEKLKKDEERVKKDEDRLKRKEDEIKRDKDLIKKDEKKDRDRKSPEDLKKDLLKKHEDLDKKEKELDRREDELRKKQPDKRIFGGGFYYLKVKRYIPDGHYNNEMFLIDPATAKVKLSSPYKNICGRKYDISSKGVVVIGYANTHSSGHFLVLLDRKTLSLVTKGVDNIYWKSFVEIKEGGIFAIVIKDGKHYLGRFDNDLKLQARSKVEVDKDTFISFYGDFVYLNAADKKILVLKKGDLSKTGTIAP